jgi:hypothetical protein
MAALAGARPYVAGRHRGDLWRSPAVSGGLLAGRPPNTPYGVKSRTRTRQDGSGWCA